MFRLDSQLRLLFAGVILLFCSRIQRNRKRIKSGLFMSGQIDAQGFISVANPVVALAPAKEIAVKGVIAWKKD
jgi:hypothetical protein